MEPIPVTSEQITFEWEHLAQKLLRRDQEKFQQNLDQISKNNEKYYSNILCNPVFRVVSVQQFSEFIQDTLT